MAQEFRPLVISGGVQKRIPDDQALEVGSVGIVAMNDGVVQKLQIGSADNKLLADGSDPASNHIEFLGGAKFNKDVLIQGELRVIGDSFALETMVTQTIFEQSVQFGDQYASDTAVFRAAIDADARQIDLRSIGNHVLLEAVTADVAGTEQDLDPAGAPGVLYFVDQANAYYWFDDNTSTWRVATSGEIEALTASAKIQASDGTMVLKSRATLDADFSQYIQLDAGNASHFKTAAGNLTLDAEAAKLVLHAGTSFEADASAASHLRTDVGNLNLEANASDSELIAKAGNKLHLEAGSYSGLVSKSQGSGDDALLMSAEGKAFLSADSDIVIDSEAVLDADAVKIIVQAGSYSAQTALESALGANDLSLSAQGKAYIQADGTVDVGSKTDVVAAALKDVALQAGSGSMPMSTDVAVDGLGQMHLASFKRMQLDSKQEILIDADAASRFSTSSGDLTLDAELGSVLVDGGENVADAVKLHASHDDGGVHVLAGSKGISLQDSSAILKLDGSGTLTDSSGALASIDLDPTGSITLDADDASHFKTSAGNLSFEAAAHLRGAAADSFSFLSNLTTPGALVFGGAAADLAALIPSGNTGANLLLLEGAQSVLKSADTENLLVQAKQANVSIEAGADASYDSVAKLALGGDLVLTAKGAIGEGTDPLDQVGGNILIQTLGQVIDTSGTLSADAAAEGFITLDSANEIRLHPANGQHVIMLKSDGSAPNLDAPADAVARIRNVMDPEKDQDVVTKKYMEENGGGTIKLIIAAAEVGTMAVGDLVSLNGSGEIIRASGDSAEEVNGRHYAVGFVSKIENTNQALVRMLGKFTLPAAHSQTPGTPIYMADTLASISGTAPSGEGDMVQRVGFYLGGSDIMVMIGEPVIL